MPGSYDKTVVISVENGKNMSLLIVIVFPAMIKVYKEGLAYKLYSPLVSIAETVKVRTYSN